MPATNELKIPEDATYFRVRMKYLKWYILFYDTKLVELDRVYGPFSLPQDAYETAKFFAVEDLDKMNIPLNV